MLSSLMHFGGEQCLQDERVTVRELVILKLLSGAKHWKNTVFRDFPTFSRTCIFSLTLCFCKHRVSHFVSRHWISEPSCSTSGNIAYLTPKLPQCDWAEAKIARYPAPDCER